MVITQPTVDDFTDTTVMRVIRKIVNYICNDLADGINNNDIVSGKFSVRGNRLSGTLTKGDGTTINIPAVTLPDGGGSDNPYPTSVDLSVSGNNLSINIPMSKGSALRDTVALPESGGSYELPIATTTELGGVIATDAGDPSPTTKPGPGSIVVGEDGKVYANGNVISVSNVNNNLRLSITDYVKFQNSLIASTRTQDVTQNGQIVTSVSGSVTDGKLKITVNGVESGDIPLPESEFDNDSTNYIKSDSGTINVSYKAPFLIITANSNGSHNNIALNNSCLTDIGFNNVSFVTKFKNNKNIGKQIFSGVSNNITITDIVAGSSNSVNIYLSAKFSATSSCIILME